jgi:hypothetical protein
MQSRAERPPPRFSTVMGNILESTTRSLALVEMIATPVVESMSERPPSRGSVLGVPMNLDAD